MQEGEKTVRHYIPKGKGNDLTLDLQVIAELLEASDFTQHCMIVKTVIKLVLTSIDIKCSRIGFFFFFL